MKAAEQVVARWNERYARGQLVDVRRDRGEVLRTHTRSQAVLTVDGRPVIWVDGIRGCYALERVTAVEEVGHA